MNILLADFRISCCKSCSHGMKDTNGWMKSTGEIMLRSNCNVSAMRSSLAYQMSEVKRSVEHKSCLQNKKRTWRSFLVIEKSV